MRKRVVAFVLALLFCAMLPGCAEEHTDSGWSEGIDGHDGVFTGEGYYYTDSFTYLYFLDVNNGVNVCLCSKIGCKHNTDRSNPEEHCEADLRGELVCYWNGGIYYTKTDNYGCHLYRRNADGTGEQHIIQLSREYTEAQMEVGSPNTRYVDGYIYYTSTIYAVTATEDGSISDAALQVLKRIDLRTGKEEEILSYPADQAMKIAAVRPDALLCLRYQYPSVDEENYEELLSQVKFELVRLDLATGQIHVIMEKAWEEGLTVRYIAGNTVIYDTEENGQSVVRSLDLNTGKDTFLYAMEYLNIINGDFGIRMTGDSLENMEYFLVDLKTGKDLPTEFKGQRLSVESVSDEGVVIMRMIRTEGSSLSTRILTYFTLESLRDGLQEEDAIDFYVLQAAGSA